MSEIWPNSRAFYVFDSKYLRILSESRGEGGGASPTPPLLQMFVVNVKTFQGKMFNFLMFSNQQLSADAHRRTDARTHALKKESKRR